MIHSHACSLLTLLMCYHYWFVFHVNANGSFIITEKYKLKLTRQHTNQSQKSAIVYHVLCFSGEIGRFFGKMFLRAIYTFQWALLTYTLVYFVLIYGKKSYCIKEKF